ncbi:MAG TPA: hypothetical protein VF297_05210 [Pyrinomonadaceae bacterium]
MNQPIRLPRAYVPSLRTTLAVLVIVAALAAFAVAVAFGQAGVRTRGAKILIEKTGDISITPVTGKKATVAGQFAPFSTKTALTAGATVTVSSTTGNFFTLTPGEDETINATTVGAQGQVLIIKVTTSGTTSRTLTFGTNFLSAGTLATGTTSGKVFQIAFLSDGTTYTELFRTGAL